MITKQDLEEAIMECKGKRNPDASTCIKLAAFFTIKEHLYPDNEAAVRMDIVEKGHSFDNVPSDKITYSGDTEFADAINGKRLTDILPLLEELMETIKVLQPNLYAGVMRRINA